MTSKERIKKALNHETPDRIPVDFGATAVSGIHVRVVEMLRDYYGLSKEPVKAIEPYQMLGEIKDDLKDAIGIDFEDIPPQQNMFGIQQEGWKEWKTHWGQTILVPGDFNVTMEEDGSTLIHPQGDTSAPASAKMPPDSYFFDAIVRQEPLDEDKLDVVDNLEEFGEWTQEDVDYWKQFAPQVKESQRGIVANFGGTGLGDIALVPAMNLKYPKGIRDIAEWYMSTAMRPDYVEEIFDRQTQIALKNLEKAYEIFGNDIDVLFICGTDFGTQESTFCAPETYQQLWHPYYKRINDWVHQHTEWKTFKHCCGAVENFMELFIESGFDIINPVQINAAGMDPQLLKDKYGDRLVFWGGGVDTQQVLPFANPNEVREQVLKQCEILSPNGGFVFNTVHNVQANVPVENVVAMIEALKAFNGA